MYRRIHVGKKSNGSEYIWVKDSDDLGVTQYYKLPTDFDNRFWVKDSDNLSATQAI